MQIGQQFYFAGCNGKPAGYCTFSETIGDLHCFDMEDGSSIALGDEDLKTIVPMERFHQMTLDEIQAMSRSLSSICSACCKPHDTGNCTIADGSVLCADCLELHLQDKHADGISIEEMDALTEAAFPSVDTKKSKEDWKSKEEFDGWAIYSGFLDLKSTRKIASHINDGPDMGESDAQRIVDCVNACAGIDNPLEQIPYLRHLATTHKDRLVGRIAELMAENEQIKQRHNEMSFKLSDTMYQRNELLKALEDAVSWFKQVQDWSGIGDPNLDQYRAAIAKAKGGSDEIA
jgi:hypothetical protein